MALGWSGSNGGVGTNSIKIDNTNDKIDLKKQVNFNDWFKEIQNNQNITEISFFINAKCNLKCPACYAKNIKDNKVISIDYWKKFLSEAIKTDNIKLVSIAGKEPLLSATETTELLQWLEEKFPMIRKGVVSNLHLITPKTAQALSGLKNFYMDVSIDGIPEIHNQLRGDDAWQKAITGVKILQNAGVNNIFVSHMLLEQNLPHFSEMVSLCAENALKKFSVFPYCSLDEKDPLLIQPNDYCQFIEKIMTPGYLKVDGAEIIVKNDYLNPEILFAAIKRFIKIDELQEDENGVLYNLYEINNNKFYFNFMPFPVDFANAVRVNYDGNVVICRDMTRPNLSDFVIGHINEGYTTIKNKLFTSEKIREFYKNYFDKINI